MAATLKCDTIQNASSATANITLDTNGNATVGNTLAMGSSFLRNRIINGDMRIDQRYAGAAWGTSINGYTVDRWSVYQSVTGKINGSQNYNSVTPPSGFKNYIGVQSQSAYTVLSGDYYGIRQIIEAYQIADLGWGTASAKAVTLSFWAYSSLTGNFGGVLQNNVDATYPFLYNIPVANTWTYITVNVPGPTIGTWLSTNGWGVGVTFSLGSGSTYQGTSGSWSSGNYNGTTGQIQLVGTNAATLYITGVQLEVGSVATPFERRQYGQELALCQRYYTVTNSTNPKGASVGAIAAIAGATNSLEFAWVFPVSMRATPSLTIWMAGTQNRARQTSTGTVVTINTLTLASGANPNSSGFIYDSGSSPFTANVGYDFDLQASAEL